MNVRKMIESLRGQITAMEEAVVQLEKLEGLSTGQKKRGRPPLPRCGKGCGRPVHKGRCRMMTYNNRRRLWVGKING